MIEWGNPQDALLSPEHSYIYAHTLLHTIYVTIYHDNTAYVGTPLSATFSSLDAAKAAVAEHLVKLCEELCSFVGLQHATLPKSVTTEASNHAS